MWNNDLIQFARLLCEIVATQDNFDSEPIVESMDIGPAELNELFDRAHEVWENAKLDGFDAVEAERDELRESVKDLLAALEMILEGCRPGWINRVAREAIAKAKGGE